MPGQCDLCRGRRAGDQQQFIKINADLARNWPSITKTKPALPDADEWKDVKNKLDQLAKYAKSLLPVFTAARQVSSMAH
jgi:hypothetical protein